MRNLFRFVTVAALLALALSGVPFGPHDAEASTCPNVGRCSDDCRPCNSDSSCRVILGTPQTCVCVHFCP